MKRQKVEIWINGHYIERCKTVEEAQLRVKLYQKQDRYEIEVCGYTNSLPTYEIKVA